MNEKHFFFFLNTFQSRCTLIYCHCVLFRPHTLQSQQNVSGNIHPSILAGLAGDLLASREDALVRQ